MKGNRSRKLGLQIFQLVAFTAIALGVSASSANAESEGHGVGEHAYHSHHLAVFLGGTYNEGDNTFTAGADYEYRLSVTNGYLGLSALVDATFSHSKHTIFAGGLVLHPVGGLKVFAYQGIERPRGKSSSHELSLADENEGEEEEDDEDLTRVGAGWDFHVGESMAITPTVSVDFVDGHRSTVYGIAFGFGF